jgi:PPOX class probable F420-dependent enzyme
VIARPSRCHVRISLPWLAAAVSARHNAVRVGWLAPSVVPTSAERNVVSAVPVKAVPEQARSLFDGRPVAFVTTVRPDGLLSTNPMAVVLDGDQVRLSTVTNRKKVRNLLADDRITVCVVQPTNPNRYVEIRGRAVLEPDTDRSFIDGIARRYMDVDRYPFDRPGDQRVTITVLAEQISFPAIPLAEDPPYERGGS